MLWLKPFWSDEVNEKPILIKAAKDYRNQFIKLSADNSNFIFTVKKDPDTSIT